METIKGRSIFYFFILIFLGLFFCFWLDLESRKSWGDEGVNNFIKHSQPKILEMIKQENLSD